MSVVGDVDVLSITIKERRDDESLKTGFIGDGGTGIQVLKVLLELHGGVASVADAQGVVNRHREKPCDLCVECVLVLVVLSERGSEEAESHSGSQLDCEAQVPVHVVCAIGLYQRTPGLVDGLGGNRYRGQC